MARSNPTPFSPPDWLRCAGCAFLMLMFPAAIVLVACCGWIGLIAVLPGTALSLCGFYALMNGHPPERLPSFSADVPKGQFSSQFEASTDRG